MAASARGYALRLQRYDKGTERLVESVLERERWSAEKWKNWREEKLAFVLHRAATRVPYYRNLWNKRRVAGDRRASDLLTNWPFLSKETLRQQPGAFVADDRNPKKMIHDHTSGTTGKPLDIWTSVTQNKEGYAIFDARSKRWYGVSYLCETTQAAILGVEPRAQPAIHVIVSFGARPDTSISGRNSIPQPDLSIWI
jgi:phenylacetate-CoA ligase